MTLNMVQMHSEIYHGERWRTETTFQASSCLCNNRPLFVGEFVTLVHPTAPRAGSVLYQGMLQVTVA